jgi:7-carboxy-7-deazaguanine synthase
MAAKVLDVSKELPLMEAFYTIQGEGEYSGSPAYFIRLGGCDVGCVWCDVKDSWEAEKWPLVSLNQIVENAAAHPARLAVITGGEPLMYNLTSLTDTLHSAGFTINVETSGAHPNSGNIDWICFSPKKFKKPLDEWYSVAHELKVVVYNKSDFKWAEEHAAKMHKDCKLYLQPEWSKREAITPLLIDYVKENPKWNISLQTHKYLDIP